MIKHSRQRDAIVEKLNGRHDHPTAETLYMELKQENPSLGLATVYRNLKQLESWGHIASFKIDGATRYDFNPRPHSHFHCIECGCVTDLDDDNDKIVEIARDAYEGKIIGCQSNYYGVCPNCLAAGGTTN